MQKVLILSMMCLKESGLNMTSAFMISLKCGPDLMSYIKIQNPHKLRNR